MTWGLQPATSSISNWSGKSVGGHLHSTRWVGYGKDMELEEAREKKPRQLELYVVAYAMQHTIEGALRLWPGWHWG